MSDTFCVLAGIPHKHFLLYLPAVRQRHAAAHHQAGLPAARRAEAGLEDRLLHRGQEHGQHPGRLRRREPQRHGPRCSLQEQARVRAGPTVCQRLRGPPGPPIWCLL